MTANRQVVLAAPIAGTPTAANFTVVDGPMPVPGPGQVLVRHVYLSLDPYQRPAIAGRHVTATRPLGIGEVPPGETVGQVVDSRHDGFRAGDYVRHFGGWQAWSVADGTAVAKVDRAVAPLSTWLGVLGMPGLTAWASAVQLAGVAAGQVVLVSAAAGPVGSLVGQIARQRGAVAVGIAGSEQKCRFVTEELGFRACVDYKAPDFPARLKAAVPEGADVYHDNVGGQMLMTALGVLKNYGTVVMCGLMSQYNDDSRSGNVNLGIAIMKRAVMKGLVVFDYEDRRQEFVDLVAPWVRSGAIRYKEDRAEGLDSTPRHFARLMTGDNVGKSLVVVGPERVS
ncbi:MAG: NADP-dependent oxidoreductase [Gammaproteobacteria bacterium]|nr:NADP-dependent oxidoreductase [Gammaproteobacteria bacterium]